jgi:pimeloyl-ACP methyl ester carboxylesterase
MGNMIRSIVLWVISIVAMLVYLPIHLVHLCIQEFFGSANTEHNRDLSSAVTVTVKSKRKFEYVLHSKVTKAQRTPRESPRIKSVLLLHGAYCSSAMWSGVAARLSRIGYEVHALDLPGFGLSTYDHAILNLNVESLGNELAEIVAAYMSHVKLWNTCVVGYSFGGFVASLCLSHAACQGKISRTLLVAPAGLFPIGGRWAHLHAVIFRLKMLSLFWPKLQNAGENLIMRFFHTGIEGSRWLLPTASAVVAAGKKCTILAGSLDRMFNVEQGLLVKEITRGAVSCHIVPLADHFLEGNLDMENAVVTSLQRLVSGKNSSASRNRKLRNDLQKLKDAMNESLPSWIKFQAGLEFAAWYSSFGNLRTYLLGLANDSTLNQHMRPVFSDTQDRCTRRLTHTQKNEGSTDAESRVGRNIPTRLRQRTFTHTARKDHTRTRLRDPNQIHKTPIKIKNNN